VLAELESERTAEHLGAHPLARTIERELSASPELPLFAGAEHPLLETLKALEPERLTPLEALNLLAEWKKRWGGE
jgi:hypothetical protein